MAGPQIDLILQRGLLPDMPLRLGALVTGRVLDARTLVLEGVRMQAQLPPDVAPGQRLRLRIEQAGADRVHLKIVERLPEPGSAAALARADAAQQSSAQETSQAQPPAQAFAMALPGGIEARVYVTDDSGSEGDGPDDAGRPVVLRYDSPTLGRLDVRLDRLSAAVHVAAGEPADRVGGHLAELKAALELVQGRDMQVTLHPRLETYDARA